MFPIKSPKQLQHLDPPRELTRRQFLHATAGGLAVVGMGSALLAQPAGDPWRGLKLGVASYSFRKFSLEQAVAMTVELGLKYISLKSVHLDLASPPSQLQAARAKIQQAGLMLMGGGVIYFQTVDEKAIRTVFDYAKGAGMPTIVASPVPAALDLVEQLAVEYDIRVAIHNHGPGDKNYAFPLDALRMVEKRDRRLGVCIDVGHTVRAGGDPIAAIHRCADRLYDFHLKDVSAAVSEGKEVVLGTGVIDLPGVLRALRSVGFSGHLEIEHEATPDDPLPGMKQSIAYLRKILAEME